MLEQFNEEIRLSVEQILKEFTNRLNEIEEEARFEYREFDTDKEAAFYFNTCKWRSILFNMRKGKPYDYLIWRHIKDELKENSI